MDTFKFYYLFQEKRQFGTRSICDNKKKCSGSNEKGEGFNELFTAIGPKLSSSISNSQTNFESYLKNPISENFVFANITPEFTLI